jgi:hypothetical protein
VPALGARFVGPLLALGLAASGCAAAVAADAGADAAAAAACPRVPYDAATAFPLPPIESRDAVRAAPAIAAARVTRVDLECSDAGGTHYTLSIAATACGRTVTSAALGGHAFEPSPTM